ncbi:MAG: SBBP repeat-containing protein [Flavobacteriales bacterium]|nr:SBBP repeat-containing protein [Flavobacteriales bacterium]
MNKTIQLLMLFFLSGNLFAQHLEWVKSLGGEQYEESYSIAVDQNGNVFTTGYFYDTADFDPGPGVYELSSPYQNDNTFISKLDSDGDFVWAASFSGGSNDPVDLVLDEQGNVYVTGYFSDSVDFNPGAGISEFITSWQAAYVVKLDANGNYLWSKMFNNAFGGAIALSSEGHIVVAGEYSGTVDFDPGSGVYNLSSSGDYDDFVVKLDSLGNFIWAKSFGGSSYDGVSEVGVDGENNIYLSGYFYNTSDFDPGVGVFELTSNGGGDCFIVKIDEDGYFQWAASYGSTGYDQVYGFGLDSHGNAYVCGHFSSTVNLNQGSSNISLQSNGSTDAIIVKYSTDGEVIWAKSLGGSSSDRAYSLDIDPLDNVVVSGYIQNTVDLDPGINEHEVTSNSGRDIFVLSLDESGIFQWGSAFGGNYDDASLALTTDIEGNIYTTGYFELTANFDFDPNNLELTSSGNGDVFIQKISPAYHLGFDVNSNLDFNLYPNPAQDYIFLDLSQFIEKVEITIYNTLGEVVYTQKTFASIVTINLDLLPGIYLVTVNDDTERVQQKLIIK